MSEKTKTSQEQSSILEWLDQQIKEDTTLVEKAKREVTAFSEMSSHSTDWRLFADPWRVTQANHETRLARWILLREIINDRDHLEHVIDRDRYIVAAGIQLIEQACRGREWTLEGRGPHEWDDDNYRKEFGFWLNDVRVALEPLRKVAWDKSDCTRIEERINAARAAANLILKAPTDNRGMIATDLGLDDPRDITITELNTQITKLKNRLEVVDEWSQDADGISCRNDVVKDASNHPSISVDQLILIANKISDQAKCLIHYAEQNGETAKPIPSVYHSQARNFEYLAEELMVLASKSPNEFDEIVYVVGEGYKKAGEAEGHIVPQEWKDAANKAAEELYASISQQEDAQAETSILQHEHIADLLRKQNLYSCEITLRDDGGYETTYRTRESYDFTTKSHTSQIEQLRDELKEVSDNVNLKAKFIDATLNQLAQADQDLQELKTKTITEVVSYIRSEVAKDQWCFRGQILKSLSDVLENGSWKDT